MLSSCTCTWCILYVVVLALLGMQLHVSKTLRCCMDLSLELYSHWSGHSNALNMTLLHPLNNGINYLSTGAGFLPSTASWGIKLWWRQHVEQTSTVLSQRLAKMTAIFLWFYSTLWSSRSSCRTSKDIPKHFWRTGDEWWQLSTNFGGTFSGAPLCTCHGCLLEPFPSYSTKICRGLCSWITGWKVTFALAPLHIHVMFVTLSQKNCVFFLGGVDHEIKLHVWKWRDFFQRHVSQFEYSWFSLRSLALCRAMALARQKESRAIASAARWSGVSDFRGLELAEVAWMFIVIQLAGW